MTIPTINHRILRFSYMKFGLAILFFSFFLNAFSQSGGQYSFPFLNLDYNARIASTGGYYLNYSDEDVNIGVANPTLLNEKMNNALSFNQAYLAGGINYGMVAYAHKIKGGMMAANVRYVDYGEFQRTEANGQTSGTFRPIEYVVGLSYGKVINPVLSVGGSLNFIGSNLENYNSYGVSLDMGGAYHHPNKLFTASVLVKNAGVKFKDYSQKEKSALPVDFQMGASYKLAHAPFRFNMILHNLNRWDLTYNDPFALPTYDALTGDTIPVPKASFIEKAARHILLSTELYVSKVITLRMGFNYHRRQEMKLVDRPGMSGFSTGLGLNFKKFRIDYGFVMYSKAGYNHIFSLSSSLDKWKKK